MHEIDRLSPKLAAYLEPVQFAAGERLFLEGDAVDGFYLIDEGIVRIQVEREEIDTDPVLSFLGAGQTVGELGLLDGQPRAASAYADEPVGARKFSKSSLAQIELEEPALGAAIFRHLGREAALKLRAANERILGHAAPRETEETAQVSPMVEAAWQAQKAFVLWSEERVNALLAALAESIAARAAVLAEHTVALTHMGSAADKTRKNRLASLGVLASLANQPGYGLLNSPPTDGVSEFAAPAGVVFGLIPMTNPVATAIFKVLICLKSRNAVILSFHRSTRELAETVGAIFQRVLEREGAPRGLIQWVRGRNSRRTTEAFFHHPGISLLLATGGRSMVEAAYRSGKPALGVGPGNAPALICLDADLDWAAQCIVESKSFDHGIICGSEHNLVVPAAIRAAFERALERAGAAVLNDEEATVFHAQCVVPDRAALRRNVLGRSAAETAAAIGVQRGHPIRLIVIPSAEVSPNNPLAMEKMAPIAGLFEVRDELEGVEVSRRLLELDGLGHTAVIHSRNAPLIERFATLMPASRILVGSPASQGVVGITTGLIPSFMLGCGTFGGTSTGDNVTYTHVRNLKRLAHFRPPSAVF